MRAVLDTNILVRATKHRTGPAREVLRCFESKKHLLVLSQFILTELVRVLNYNRVQALHRLTPEERQEFVLSLEKAAHIVDLQNDQINEPISTDPDDDPVIQTAVEGKAEVICTLDKHFRQPNVLKFCQQNNIRVLSDVEFLKELQNDQTNTKSD